MEYRRDGRGEEKAGHKVFAAWNKYAVCESCSQEQSQRHFGVPKVVGSDVADSVVS